MVEEEEDHSLCWQELVSVISLTEDGVVVVVVVVVVVMVMVMVGVMVCILVSE